MIGIFPYRTEIELKRIPTSTLYFMLACFLVHIITWRMASISREALYGWWNLTGYHFHFPPSAISYIFIHMNFHHVFFNMAFFFFFAAPLETVEGKQRFWILLLFSGFFAAYFSTFVLGLFAFWPDSPLPWINYRREHHINVVLIGASGAVMAFAAAYLVRFWNKKLYVVLTLWGIPVKRTLISPWVMVLVYWLLRDVVFGIMYQGIIPLHCTAHFAHLGGFVAGFALSFYWKFHKNMKRDWYVEQARELLKAPVRGARAALKTYEQALEFDPKNGEILLELARLYHTTGNRSSSEDYYRSAVKELSRAGLKDELVEAYSEALKRYSMVFISEKQISLARELLDAGKWRTAEACLRHFCRQLEHRGLDKKKSSLYIRANLFLAHILDHYHNNFIQARAMIRDLIRRFPDHPMLKYPAKRLKVTRENNELFRFYKDEPGHPLIFTGMKKPEKKEVKLQEVELPWNKVRPGLVFKVVAVIILLSPVTLIALAVLFFIVSDALHALF